MLARMSRRRGVSNYLTDDVSFTPADAANRLYSCRPCLSGSVPSQAMLAEVEHGKAGRFGSANGKVGFCC